MVIINWLRFIKYKPTEIHGGNGGPQSNTVYSQWPSIFSLWLSVGLNFKLSFRHINSGAQMVV